ncbi:8-amino-7-oxononanoate synthase [Sphingomonas sp. M1A8_2b]
MMFADQIDDLANLAAADRRRALSPRRGIDFASNDYLGLAGSERLRGAMIDALGRGVAVGSGGSRLLRGNAPEHEALEAQAARLFRTEAALFFASGYAANTILFATLPQRGDLIVHDALIHASAHEGMRLTRATCVGAAHNDADAFEDAIAGWRKAGGTGRVWIAVESLYSMDGDQAPLVALAEIADRHDAILLIDEAHATGVFGPDGRGLAHALDGRENVITLRTCGKAVGCEGALLCGPAVMREFIVNRGRGFIFSTAPSPLMALAVSEALRIIVDEPARRDQLWALIAVAERVLAPYNVMATGSQILPLVLGDAARTMRIAGAIQAAGFDVRGIRPPTVPEGGSRLRISLTRNVTADDIEALGKIMEETLR